MQVKILRWEPDYETIEEFLDEAQRIYPIEMHRLTGPGELKVYLRTGNVVKEDGFSTEEPFKGQVSPKKRRKA